MKKTKILIPIYNDWLSVFKLLVDIDIELNGWDAEISVFIINDASTMKRPINTVNFNNLKSIKIINMKSNQGHARCIATGLKYINEKEDFDFIIPMDGDGEDRPEELGSLLCAGYEYPDKVITADRIKRSEGVLFKFCYWAHKSLTFSFTGHSIKFGNYTCLPKFAVNKMVNEPATWSSFSGSLTKTITNRTSVSSIRGTRNFGPSKMSFINLLKHSLSIIAVFKKRFLIRTLLFLIFYSLLIIGKLSFVTLAPVIFVIFMMISVFLLSKRESLLKLNSSLENIESVDQIK